MTNEADNTVSVIDSRTGETEKTIQIGAKPRGIGFSHDRSQIYVALGDEDAIGVIDTESLEVVKKISAGYFYAKPNLRINGRDNGVEAFEQYMETKTIWIDLSEYEVDAELD